MNDRPSPLLRVRDLRVGFDLPEGRLVAVDGVSFQINAGATVALVGESGSGKSVVSQTIMGLLPPIAQVLGGSIMFADPASPGTLVDITCLPQHGRQMRSMRGGRISIIFQEPMTSLSPLHTVGDQIREALELHRRVSAREATELTRDMLRMVGFPDPEKALRTYPFELSGGLRQRAMISMALICRPALLIADEPTTALDVTIQAQILKLIKDLQAELNMAALMITHDLGVVANVAEEVVVMYRGRVMESGAVEDIYRRLEHPYRHLLPSFMSHLIASATLSIPSMILGEAALSFLGLGLRPPITFWGVLLTEAQNLNAVELYPWIMTPVIPVILVVLAFNFFGDGLRDAADPYK